MPTTLPPNTCVATLTFDEVLVSLLKRVPAVVACGANIYHIEVWQSLKRSDRYPALVYQMLDDVPELELAGTSNFYKGNYELTVFATSAQLRSISNGLQIFNDEQFNLDVSNANCNIDWLGIVSDTEQVEYALEQQDKGIKYTTHTITIDHWGKL